MTMPELSTCVAAKRNFRTSGAECHLRTDSHGEAASLRKQNADLKARIEEMEQALLDNQRDQENMLDEQSDVIRGLHRRIQVLQEMPAGQVNRIQVSDLVEMWQQRDEDRRRLKEDEEAVMAQMRETEIAISKERLELARQRAEVLRLIEDTRLHEDSSVRNADLRHRLAALRPGHDKDPVSSTDPAPAPAKSNSSFLRRLFGK
jgi:hypothetical protein